MELKKRIEALLFSSGRKMDVEEISKLCHIDIESVKSALAELKKEYDEKSSSLMLVEEGNSWKLTVKESYLHLVKKIVTETELSKTMMETLAVIAFTYPIKQSELIKIRTNKAYDHLNQLEEMGYITRQKYGRTKLIKLTTKFFDYFSLPEEKLKDTFKDFESIANAIKEKEEEIKKIKEEQRKKATEMKKQKIKDFPISESKDSEKKEKEVDLIDEEGHKEKLEVYKTKKPKEETKVEVVKEKLGDLEVVDEPEELTEETWEEPTVEKEIEEPTVEKRVKEIFHPKKRPVFEEEPIVDKRVREILDPTKEIKDPAVDKRVSEILYPKKSKKKKTKKPEELIKTGGEEIEETTSEEEKDLLEAEMEEDKKEETE